MPWRGRPSEGALGYAGVSGGLGEGYRGEGGLLAEGEFGNFDFPAISGHFGPLYLTVGGGCSVRVGFGIGVALGELGAGSLLWFSGIKHRVASVALWFWSE